MIKGIQVKMARAALGWGVRELAAKAQIMPNTVSRVENALPARKGTLDALENALGKAGIEFIEENGGGPGVRLKK